MAKSLSRLRLFFYAVGISLLVWEIWQSLFLTRSALLVTQVLRGDVAARPMAEQAVAAERLAQSCQSVWLRGRLADHFGDRARANQSWQALISCSVSHVPLIIALRPQDIDLAQQAARTQPDSAVAWFWLADSYRTPGDWSTPLDPRNYDLLVSYYRAGLHRDPGDDVRWRELGDVLSTRDLPQAVEAYANACYYGDSGSNGCWRAGQAAERLGDFAKAIDYYQMSPLLVAQQRAADLKHQLNLP